MLSLTAVSLGACTDEPSSYSDAVGINLKAKSSDVIRGVVIDEKAITTESSNPYGAFVNAARRDLGANPSAIEVAEADLLLGASSNGVASLDAVFADRVDVLFQMNDTNNTYPVATGSVLGTASGPLALDVTFTSDTLSPQDYAKLLGGSFKVITRGVAAPGFDGKDASADLQVTFTFAAFE
jgi:hypothetical protein